MKITSQISSHTLRGHDDGNTSRRIGNMPENCIGEPQDKSRIDIVLATVMAFSFDPLVHRMVDKYGWTEEKTLVIFEDTKMFLYNAAVSTKPTSPTPEVDEVWHNFILFTKDYAAFCQTMFGKFIHHVPFLRGEKYANADCGDGPGCLSGGVCATDEIRLAIPKAVNCQTGNCGALSCISPPGRSLPKPQEAVKANDDCGTCMSCKSCNSQ